MLLLVAPSAWAVDGVVEINQARALAGGVTPGDAAGYPITIDTAGSYRLTGDLTVPDEDTHGILIEAPNVSVDLNGFSLIGPTVCTGAGSGLSCAPTGFGNGIYAMEGNLTVRNGTVRGIGQAGIVMRGTGNLVENVRAVSNGLVGIAGTPEGVSADVKNCTAIQNNHAGIFLRHGGQIVGNHLRDNLDAGIVLFEASNVQDNVATGNGLGGIRIFGGAGRAIGNICTDNEGAGMNLTADIGYADNVLNGNTGGTVTSGVEIGTNLCDGGTTCP